MQTRIICDLQVECFQYPGRVLHFDYKPLYLPRKGDTICWETNIPQEGAYSDYLDVIGVIHHYPIHNEKGFVAITIKATIKTRDAFKRLGWENE